MGLAHVLYLPDCDSFPLLASQHELTSTVALCAQYDMKKETLGSTQAIEASKPVSTQLHTLPPVAPGTGNTTSLPTPNRLFCNTEVVVSASKCYCEDYRRPVINRSHYSWLRHLLLVTLTRLWAC